MSFIIHRHLFVDLHCLHTVCRADGDDVHALGEWQRCCVTGIESCLGETHSDYNATTKKSTEAGVYYSYNAVEWAPIETLKGYTAEDLADGETTKPEHKVYDITKCFTDDTTPVYLAWQYKGKLAQHMAIDNVRVYNGESASIAAANADMKFRVEGNAVVVGGMAGNVSVCTPSGMCLAEARLNAGDTAKPLPSR